MDDDALAWTFRQRRTIPTPILLQQAGMPLVRAGGIDSCVDERFRNDFAAAVVASARRAGCSPLLVDVLCAGGEPYATWS